MTTLTFLPIKYFIFYSDKIDMQSKSLLTFSKLCSRNFTSAFQTYRAISTMKHIALNGFGEASVITIGESKIPQPKEDQVLIKVKTSALNRADTLQRRGKYPPPKGNIPKSNIKFNHIKEPPRYSDWKQLAIFVRQMVHSKYSSFYDQLRPSDESRKVMALLEGGGHAQYCVAHKDHIIDIPDNLSLEEAGGLPETWITAFQMLETARIQPKEKVLIYAGASGVGTSAIQLTRLFGGIPIVTCSTEDKIEFTKKMGAEAAINYKKTENLSKAILDITGPRGVDIILDCVGPAYASNAEVAGIDSRWMLYGLLTGAKANNFNFAALVTKRISIIATTLRTRSAQYKGDLVRRFTEKVVPHFKDGKCKVCIDSIVDVDWKDAKPIQDAHLKIEENKNSGKIILRFKD